MITKSPNYLSNNIRKSNLKKQFEEQSPKSYFRSQYEEQSPNKNKLFQLKFRGFNNLLNYNQKQ